MKSMRWILIKMLETKKRELGHTETPAMCAHRERLCEETRRQPSAFQRERPQKEPNLLTH